MQLKEKHYQLFIHLITWVIIIVLPFIFFDKPEHDFPKGATYLFFFRLVLFVTIFYVNYFFYIPYLLFRKRFFFYAIAIITSIAFIIYSNIGIANYFLSEDFIEGMKVHNITGKIVYTSIFLLGISTSITVTQNWYKNEEQKNVIKSEKLNSELSFLKSQVNPHFLFNTLNNIYSLANRKSEHTPDAIMKLSHLMRYMIYETKKDTVDLQKEINYLTDYIELQKLRMLDKSKVIFNIDNSECEKEIEPMLLIPFVENAFKHGDIFSEDAKIEITLRIKDNELYFKVENNIDKKIIEDKDKGSGIGLNNLKKRLELLYPENHIFATEIINDIFVSELKINFKL